MIQLIDDKASCFGCSACQAVCPTGAISMQPDTEGFLYPVIDEKHCMDCGLCSEICPGKNPAEEVDGVPFALRCKDQELLKKSTSGGAFSLAAHAVLESGGLVCGAVFDEDFHVHHVLSGDIAPMRKSKYVQSDIQGMYTAVKDALEAGRKVLFTGTPCQCHGLLRYFGEQPEQLILAALICRGVQSPGLWQDYIANLAAGGSLEAYCFRDKQTRNDGHTVSYTVDGEERSVSMNQDRFSRLYLKCLTLRPSCYQCPYTKWELPFDLTIGDFWGIENSHPEFCDGKGVSLVIVRTEKGRSLLETVRSQGIVVEVSRDEALQPALKEPPKETILRKLLYKDYARKNENGFCDIPLILKKYGG